jgi:hypothetical protein
MPPDVVNDGPARSPRVPPAVTRVVHGCKGHEVTAQLVRGCVTLWAREGARARGLGIAELEGLAGMPADPNDLVLHTKFDPRQMTRCRIHSPPFSSPGSSSRGRWDRGACRPSGRPPPPPSSPGSPRCLGPTAGNTLRQYRQYHQWSGSSVALVFPLRHHHHHHQRQYHHHHQYQYRPDPAPHQPRCTYRCTPAGRPGRRRWCPDAASPA